VPHNGAEKMFGKTVKCNGGQKRKSESAALKFI
jgi:hypothetical protein